MPAASGSATVPPASPARSRSRGVAKPKAAPKPEEAPAPTLELDALLELREDGLGVKHEDADYDRLFQSLVTGAVVTRTWASGREQVVRIIISNMAGVGWGARLVSKGGIRAPKSLKRRSSTPPHPCHVTNDDPVQVDGMVDGKIPPTTGGIHQLQLELRKGPVHAGHHSRSMGIVGILTCTPVYAVRLPWKFMRLESKLSLAQLGNLVDQMFWCTGRAFKDACGCCKTGRVVVAQLPVEGSSVCPTCMWAALLGDGTEEPKAEYQLLAALAEQMHGTSQPVTSIRRSTVRDVTLRLKAELREQSIIGCSDAKAKAKEGRMQVRLLVQRMEPQTDSWLRSQQQAQPST